MGLVGVDGAGVRLGSSQGLTQNFRSGLQQRRSRQEGCSYYFFCYLAGFCHFFSWFAGFLGRIFLTPLGKFFGAAC